MENKPASSNVMMGQSKGPLGQKLFAFQRPRGGGVTYYRVSRIIKGSFSDADSKIPDRLAFAISVEAQIARKSANQQYLLHHLISFDFSGHLNV